MKTPVRIGLFGAGNVGTHLLRRLDETDGVEVVGLWNRHPGRWAEWAGKYKVVAEPEEMPPADVYILALKDDVLEPFSQRLPHPHVLTVHTSGAQPSYVLRRARRGVFYPLQTFVRNRPVDWTRIPILVHAPVASDESFLEDLARRLSPMVYHVDDAQRARLHVAAVFASNYTNAMVQMAREIMHEAGLSADMLTPLMEKTFRNMLDDDPARVLTGPARRGDRRTVDRHLALLKEMNREDLMKIYREVAEWIMDKYGPKGD